MLSYADVLRRRWFAASGTAGIVLWLVACAATSSRDTDQGELGPRHAGAEARMTRQVVIGHRGASGYLPEHTLPAYALAYGLGADMIEPDVVLTRDAVAICAHDITIQHTQAVERLHADRRRPDGKFYYIDFDLAELRAVGTTLGRDAAAANDPERNEPAARLPGFQLATFAEMIQLVQRLNRETGRNVGIIPEPKDAAFHRREGRPIETEVAKILAEHGYRARTDNAIIQCFEMLALQQLRQVELCDLRLVYLAGEPISAETLDQLVGLADGIGPSRKLIESEQGGPGTQPDIIRQARARGLKVYPYTFKRDLEATRRFLRVHRVDGLFTDFPDVGLEARDHHTEH